METSLYYQMMQMLEGLKRPEGVLYLSLALVLAAVTLGVRSLRWFLTAMLLYICTFGVSTFTGRTLATPLQQIRLYGRGSCAFLLFLLLIPTLRSHRGWRMHVLPASLVLYYVFQLAMSGRFLYGGDFVRGYFGVLSFSLAFATLAYGVSRWLQGPGEADAAVKAIAGGAMLFCLGCLYQYFINPGEVVWGGRFQGTTGNANHAAVVLGVGIPPGLYIFIRSRARHLLAGERSQSDPWLIRFTSALLTSLLVVMLVWTGSRSGAIVALFGIILLFRFRLGKLAMVLMICGVAVFTLIKLLDEVGISSIATRLLELKDTRSENWKTMFGTFIDSPFIGKEASESVGSENSFLLVAARTGLVGLIPFTCAIGLIIYGLVRLQRVRRYLGDQQLLADLVTAGILSILLGAMFEGYLFATYSFPLFALFIYVGLMVYLRDYAHAMQYYQQQAQQGYFDEHDAAYEDLPAESEGGYEPALSHDPYRA
jgi:hypothetical protein